MQEIQAISCIFWSRRRDSNPRPLRPERNALPTALRLDIRIVVFRGDGLLPTAERRAKLSREPTTNRATLLRYASIIL